MNPDPKPRTSGGKRVLLAAGVTAILVGAALVIGPRLDEADSLRGASAETMTTDSTGRIQALGAEPLPGGIPTGPLGDGPQLLLEEAVAQALAQVDSAAAAAHDPAVPSGYVLGGPVEAVLEGSTAPVYELPAFPALPPVGGVGLGVPDLPGPVQPRGGLGLPVGGLGGVPDPIQSIREAVGGLGLPVDTGPVDGLLGPLGGGGLPTGLPPLPGGLGLPTGEQDPEQAAQGAVDPDETGAQFSLTHADTVLATATDAFSQAQTGLDRLAADYTGLAKKVDGILADTQKAADSAEAGVNRTLAERLGSLRAETSGVQSHAHGILERHTALLAETQAGAEAGVQGALGAQQQAVADLAAARLDAIGEVSAAATAEAESRIATIGSEVDAATAALADLEQRTGKSQAGNVAALHAAGHAAVADVKAQLAAVLAQAESATAEAEADLESSLAALQATADEAMAEVQSRSDAGVAEAMRVESYARTVAQDRLDHLTAMEQAAAGKAVQDLQAAAEAHAEAVVAEALAATGLADGLLDDTEDLVGQLGVLAMDGVSSDIAYIEQVSEDYGRVPTPDRKAASDRWASVATSLSWGVDGSLALGQDVLESADAMAQAADSAKAKLAAL